MVVRKNFRNHESDTTQIYGHLRIIIGISIHNLIIGTYLIFTLFKSGYTFYFAEFMPYCTDST